MGWRSGEGFLEEAWRNGIPGGGTAGAKALR